MGLLRRGYKLLIAAGNALQSPFLLLLRLYFFWPLAHNGWDKLHNLGRVTNYFSSLGIPMPAVNAAFISTLECVGGVLLILGLGSRLIALLLTGDMLVAYITADRGALMSVISDPDKFTGAAEYTILFASLLVLIFGPGRFSVDAILARRVKSPPVAADSAGAHR